MKIKATTVFPILLLLGMCLLLYPTVSDYWNSLHQSKVIAGYMDTVASISKEDSSAILAEARAYNDRLSRQTVSFLTEEQRKEYYKQLDVTGNGVLGYIEIPDIQCRLPVYHGTSDSTLQVAAGHIEGSSLPVGGVGSHCVISGHRGLPSAKLFTNLDQLREGDVFLLSVLNETLTYEVDQISVVKPEDVSELGFDPTIDLCTLVTCTPYGVNSHRLLVRGHRVPNESVTIKRVTPDAVQIHRILTTAVVASPAVIAWGVWLFRRRPAYR